MHPSSTFLASCHFWQGGEIDGLILGSRFRCLGEGSPSLQTRIEGQHRNHTAETLIFCQEPTLVIFFCGRPFDKNVKNSKILGFFMLLWNPIQRHKPSTRSMGFTVSSFSIVWIACDGNSQSICIPPNAMLEASRSAGIHLKAWQGNVPPPFRFRCSHRGDLVGWEKEQNSSKLTFHFVWHTSHHGTEVIWRDCCRWRDCMWQDYPYLTSAFSLHWRWMNSQPQKQ